MKCSNRLEYSKNLNSIAKTVGELTAQGKRLFNASSSNPLSCGMTPDKSVYSNFFSDGIMSYDPLPKGMLLAREALADYYGSCADKFYLTASTSEAYSWLFKLLGDPGDCFLVPKPGYPLFDFLAKQELVEILPYQLEYAHPSGWFIDIDNLVTLLKSHKPKAIILINPNNPTGSYVRRDEYNAIISLCREHDMCIIADEVFFPHRLTQEEDHISFMHCEEVPTFTLNGLSKLLCMPQVKLGWIHLSGINDPRVEDSLELIADTFLSANIFAMSALPALLQHAPIWIDTVRSRISGNYEYALKALDETTVFRPRTSEGGWSLMLEVPRFLPDDEFIIHLLKEQSMYVQPGYFFDCKDSGIIVPSLILPSSDFRRCISSVQEAISFLYDSL